jgi:hypothetical protein
MFPYERLHKSEEPLHVVARFDVLCSERALLGLENKMKVLTSSSSRCGNCSMQKRQTSWPAKVDEEGRSEGS